MSKSNVNNTIIDDEMVPPEEENKRNTAIVTQKPTTTQPMSKTDKDALQNYISTQKLRPIDQILQYLYATLDEKYCYEYKGEIDFTKAGAYWIAREYKNIEVVDHPKQEQIIFKDENGEIDKEKSGWLTTIIMKDTQSNISSVGVGFKPFYAEKKDKKTGEKIKYFDQRSVIASCSIAERNAILDLVDNKLVKKIVEMAKNQGKFQRGWAP